MSNRKKPDRERMVRAAQRLVNLSKRYDPLVLATAQKLLDRINMLSMDDILAKVPGESQVAKARHIGVTRETVYGWTKGRCRPYPEQAERLAKITGFPAGAIRGTRSR